eukprot:CAMPEP_0174265516 /NCGR_PEP_ID=MMETSP0439-20130205/26800_1 /TAXON_ID=0 /ORGANISM="Stereomyxa ramosa, Strain Chinc5" /LENGTH=170 /DNA_ID=CAMNT_0015352015 /DNA_START=232 /DNA_END=740 /DNA_ORIENTATION=-
MDTFIGHGLLKDPHLVNAINKINPIHFIHDYANVQDGETASKIAKQLYGYMLGLQLLNPRLKTGMNVLNVGINTGITTATMTILVGHNGGHVYGISDNQLNILDAESNIESHYANKIPKSYSLHFVDDILDGFIEGSPYDAIFVNDPVSEIPKRWKDQMKIGGLMIVPVL